MREKEVFTSRANDGKQLHYLPIVLCWQCSNRSKTLSLLNLRRNLCGFRVTAVKDTAARPSVSCLEPYFHFLPHFAPPTTCFSQFCRTRLDKKMNFPVKKTTHTQVPFSQAGCAKVPKNNLKAATLEPFFCGTSLESYELPSINWHQG